ncbi:hypothetical protein [Methanobrevibacter sp.]|uniref:hypothetical protein n=1 Tax=Methanobrevibacter sp. TaxID=66852 RepID=UPI0038634AD4
MELIYNKILEVILEIIVFLVLMAIFKFIADKIKNNPHKILNLKEYFPEEEIHSLKQVFYLIMMGLFFINILYVFIIVESDIIYFVIFDIALSLYLAIKLDKSSLKNKILLLLLIPYGSLTYILFGNSLVGVLDLIHVPVFIYFIKVYYDKFMEYTESNGLGITIILLYTLIFVSFLVTQVAENVNPLDSLVMVSNAFTSNGYAILGSTLVGKINNIFLVWGGYLLSGVGTATLTAAILIRHFNSRFDELEELIKKNNDE